MNASEASAALGLSYDTFRDALGTPGSPIDATYVRPAETDEERRRGRWEIPAAEVKRLAAFFELPLRELPAPGQKRLTRTRPAAVMLSAATAARIAVILRATESSAPMFSSMITDAAADLAGDAVTGVATDHRQWTSDDRAMVNLLTTVEGWRKATAIGQCREIRLRGAEAERDLVSAWDLLHVEALAVRLGKPAPHVLTALVELRIADDLDRVDPRLKPSSGRITIDVDAELLAGLRALRGGDATRIVQKLLNHAAADHLLGHHDRRVARL